jgi:hypothetical protein
VGSGEAIWTERADKDGGNQFSASDPPPPGARAGANEFCGGLIVVAQFCGDSKNKTSFCLPFWRELTEVLH